MLLGGAHLRVSVKAGECPQVKGSIPEECGSSLGRGKPLTPSMPKANNFYPELDKRALSTAWSCTWLQEWLQGTFPKTLYRVLWKREFFSEQSLSFRSGSPCV